MTAATLTLADFLLARIAEDEKSAREATPGPWRVEGHRDEGPEDAAWSVESATAKEHGYPASVVEVDLDRDYHMPMGGCVRRPDAEHIARHDATRVLDRCVAERQIVELHGWTKAAYIGDEPQISCETCGTPLDSPEPWPCQTLRWLATSYADHPDYRSDWRP